MVFSVKENSKFSRDDIVKYLNENRVATRLMFGGNLVRQPAYKDKEYIVNGTIENADFVMKNTFWIGVYPGINDEMIDYIDSVFESFLKQFN